MLFYAQNRKGKVMDKKSITVFSQELCAELMLAGHRLQAMAKDRKYPDRNVFFFENTEAIRTDMREILNTQK